MSKNVKFNPLGGGAKKPKFKPVITRVKLNPEQAVLSCNCATNGAVLCPTGTSRTVISDMMTYCQMPGRNPSGMWPCRNFTDPILGAYFCGSAVSS